MVSAYRVSAARGALDSVRHQQGALRDPKGHHGGEEKRNCSGHARIALRLRRSDTKDRKNLCTDENKENGIFDRHTQGSGNEAGRKVEVRGARDLAMKILVITELRQGKWNNASFETLAAAQHIAKDTSSALAALVIGKNVAAFANDLASKNVAEVLTVEHDLLEAYTPDGYCVALKQAIESAKPDLVLFPHTYQVRDFAPKLAAMLGKGMIGDCIGYRIENGKLQFVRQMFQGKTAADVTFLGECPWFASFQSGAFRADQLKASDNGARPIHPVTIEVKAEQIRTKALELFKEAKSAVDLTQAPLIVAGWRGGKGAGNTSRDGGGGKSHGGERAAVAS